MAEGGSPERAAGKSALMVLAGLAVGSVLFLVILILAPVVLFPDVFAQDSSTTNAPVGTTTGTSPGPVPADLIAVFNQAGTVFKVNPYLLASVAEQESSFGAGAGWNTVNFAGCVGFMQTCVGGAGGDSWDGHVTLAGAPQATIVDRQAYSYGPRPTGYSPATATHPSYNDAYDAVMAGAVELRGKVGGVPIPNLDNTAYLAACGYYGACADASANYAQVVLSRAQQWQGENALSIGGPAVTPGKYVNPMGQIAQLTPERVDEGVDYAGSGPLLALGDGTVFFSASTGVGWPRNCWSGGCDGLGGFVGYRLTDGQYSGKDVYVAENIDPLVSTGQTIRAGQPIATLHLGGANLETGWASGSTSQPLAASLHQGDPSGDIGGWVSAAGASFNRLLVALGAVSGNLHPAGEPGGVHGTMPPGSGYP